MRSALLLVLGAVAALILVISTHSSPISSVNAADNAPAPSPAPEPPESCVKCSGSFYCVGSGNEGAVSCKLGKWTNTCTEVGFCWVSDSYPQWGMGL